VQKHQQLGKPQRIRAKVILAGTTDPERVRDIIFGNNRAEFEEMSRIVLAEPDGKAKFAKAVGQVIADKAQVVV
jgi:hypothetical protein